MSARDGVPLVRLGTVCRDERQLVDGGSISAKTLPYIGLEDIESQSGRIIQTAANNGRAIGSSTTFKFCPQHVLYGKLRPYLNKVALPDFEGRCTTEIIPLLPSTELDRRYLAWFLRQPETVRYMMIEVTGSRMPRADIGRLLSLEIPLPELAEQRRIVAMLDRQMALVEKTRALANAQNEQVVSLKNALYRRAMDTLLSTYGSVRVSDCCESIDYGYTTAANPEIGAPKFLRITDIQEGAVNWSKVPGCNIDERDKARYRLKGGDIVFARTGGTTGKSFLLCNPPDSVFASYLIRLRPTEGWSSDFIYAFFQSPQYWSQIQSTARGGAQPNINATLLGSLRIPNVPVDRQTEAVATLSVQTAQIDSLRIACEEQTCELEKAGQAILRTAFGERTGAAAPI